MTTVASNRRRLASFAEDVLAGTTTVAEIPSRCAAQATPSAWFPLEAVTTPVSPPAAVRAARAPRTLNEPVGWKLSSLSRTFSPRPGLGTSGVGGSAAATTSLALARWLAQSIALAVVTGEPHQAPPAPGRR